MISRISILWTFAKSVGLPMLTLTLVSMYLVIENQNFTLTFLFFWLKLVVAGLVFFFWNNLRGNELYYYYNLGISKRFLFGAIGVADMLIFSLLHLFVSIWI